MNELIAKLNAFGYNLSEADGIFFLQVLHEFKTIIPECESYGEVQEFVKKELIPVMEKVMEDNAKRTDRLLSNDDFMELLKSFVVSLYYDL